MSYEHVCALRSAVDSGDLDVAEALAASEGIRSYLETLELRGATEQAKAVRPHVFSSIAAARSAISRILDVLDVVLIDKDEDAAAALELAAKYVEATAKLIYVQGVREPAAERIAEALVP